MKRNYFILPILAGVMYGSTGIFVRTLTENGIDSTTLLFLRFSIAIFAILLSIIISDKSLIKITLKDIPLFLITGICILGLNLCYNYSINTVNLSVAAVLLSTAPIFVVILAYIIFGEKITMKKSLSIILAIFGCILTTGVLENTSSSISLFGIIGGFGAAIFWAAYTLTSRKAINDKIHTYTILLYSLIIITLITFPFTNFTQIESFIFPNPIQNIIFLVLHSIISFALPYVFITLSLNYLDSGEVSIFTSGSEPLSALIFGIIIYFETPSPIMLIGIIITITAIIILSSNTTKSDST